VVPRDGEGQALSHSARTPNPYKNDADNVEHEVTPLTSEVDADKMLSPEWRDVPGWEGEYRVHRSGRVVGIKRIVECRDGRRQRVPAHELTPDRGCVLLSRARSRRMVSVAKLVREVFPEKLTAVVCAGCEAVWSRHGGPGWRCTDCTPPAAVLDLDAFRAVSA
jgi:NUMOD4 motif-containing protein